MKNPQLELNCACWSEEGQDAATGGVHGDTEAASRWSQHHGDRAPTGAGSQDGAEVFAAGAAAVSAPAAEWKIDAYRAYLRERWEQGVANASRLFRDLQKRGYSGGYTQVKTTVREWRREGQERAFVRFETAPGEQSQLDWGHFGNWAGARLYAFVLLLCYSRMRYVEFTQRQDAETLLNCLVHAFHYFGGVTASLLTDNMKTVVVERVEGQPQWNPRFLDFAAYYGFVPRVCHPYRPETKGKVEATIRYLRTSFWPGVQFSSLEELNRQAFEWCQDVNGRVHATTRAVPRERFTRAIEHHPASAAMRSEQRCAIREDCN